MRGMELMISSMMKSLGLDPVVVMQAIQAMANGVQQMQADMAEVKNRLERIEALQRGEVPAIEIQPHVNGDDTQ